MKLWSWLFGRKHGGGRKSSIVNVKVRILDGIKRTRGNHWMWQRARAAGHGVISAACLARHIKSNTIPVHRAAYMVWNGPLDPKEYVFQTCKLAMCCNPGHLIKSTTKADSPKYGRK
jgi:hypothetical protein